jgi:hypothetical protein
LENLARTSRSSEDHDAYTPMAAPPPPGDFTGQFWLIAFSFLFNNIIAAMMKSCIVKSSTAKAN